MEFAIETHKLTKEFAARFWHRSRTTIRGVDSATLNIEPGQIFGLLGPNGAGKTTLIKMLCTLITPTSGQARVNGFDLLREPDRIRQTVGLVTSDERSFYWRLSGRENLHFFAALHNLSPRAGRERTQQLLEQVELAEHADRPFQTYSTGMRQRLALARGLLRNPEILFLDEPTKGLDPAATTRLHSLIRDDLVGRQRKTVWLTTQILSEAEKLCHHLAIIQQGKIRASGTLTQLKTQYATATRYSIAIKGLPRETLDALISGIDGLKVTPSMDGSEQEIEMTTDPSRDELERVIDAIVRSGGRVCDVQRSDSSLESLFTRDWVDSSGRGNG